LKDGVPDFYPIGSETLTEKYQTVSLDLVAEKNSKLVKKLKDVGLESLFSSGDPRLKGLLKTVPVPLIRMSDLD
jgi:hypothetical protein